jgi:hypothetical protein
MYDDVETLLFAVNASLVGSIDTEQLMREVHADILDIYYLVISRCLEGQFENKLK